MRRTAAMILMVLLLLLLSAAPAAWAAGGAALPAAANASVRYLPSVKLYPPKGFKARVSGSQVKFSWKKNARADGYAIYEKLGPWQYELLCVTQKTSWTYSYAEKGEHVYCIRSWKGSPGERQSNKTAEVTVRIASSVTPGVPDRLLVEQSGPREVKLSWKKGSGASYYLIYRSTERKSGYKKIKKTKKTGYTDTVPGDGLYYYRVYSVKDAGGVKRTTKSPARSVLVNPEFGVKDGGVCRALLIGNTYPGTILKLPGPDNDVRSMQKMLGLMKTSDIKVTSKLNASSGDILSLIGTAFAGAGEEDVSIFYYSGHGQGDDAEIIEGAGGLIGTDEVLVTPQLLRRALEKIPGKKIVILDSCFSGMHIYDGPGSKSLTQTALARNNQKWIRAFAGAPKGPDNVADEGFYVITAAAYNEQSMSMNVTKKRSIGVMTQMLLRGSGYDAVRDRADWHFAADKNGDRRFTISELALYARNSLNNAMDYIQQVQWWWPAGGQDQVLWQW